MASPGSFTADQVLTAAEMNALPGGQVGAQTLVSIYSTSATHTTFQDTGMTLTIAEVSGRVYRHSARLNPYPSGGLQAIELRLLGNGTQFAIFVLSPVVLDQGISYPFCPVLYYTAPSTTSVVWKWQIRAQTNNTVVSDYGDANFVRQYSVEDVSE